MEKQLQTQMNLTKQLKSNPIFKLLNLYFMKSALPILLFVCSLFFQSCKNYGLEFLKTEKKRVIFLYDLSSSIDPKAQSEYYEKIEYVLNTLGKHDAFCVYPIDGASTTSFEALVPEVDFYKDRGKFVYAGLNKSDSELKTKEAFKTYCSQMVENLKQAVNNKIESRIDFNNNTDIIGAIAQATEDVKSKSDVYTSQAIVILSDMEQFADKGVKMYKNRSVEEWLSQDSCSLNLPKELPIAVITGSQKMDAKTYDNIKKYWISFFEKRGGKLITYNSAQNTNLDKIFNE